MNKEDKKAGRPKQTANKRTLSKTVSITPEHLELINNKFGSLTNCLKYNGEILKVK